LQRLATQCMNSTSATLDSHKSRQRKHCCSTTATTATSQHTLTRPAHGSLHITRPPYSLSAAAAAAGSVAMGSIVQQGSSSRIHDPSARRVHCVVAFASFLPQYATLHDKGGVRCQVPGFPSCIFLTPVVRYLLTIHTVINVDREFHSNSLPFPAASLAPPLAEL